MKMANKMKIRLKIKTIFTSGISLFSHLANNIVSKYGSTEPLPFDNIYGFVFYCCF